MVKAHEEHWGRTAIIVVVLSLVVLAALTMVINKSVDQHPVGSQQTPLEVQNAQREKVQQEQQLKRWRAVFFRNYDRAIKSGLSEKAAEEEAGRIADKTAGKPKHSPEDAKALRSLLAQQVQQKLLADGIDVQCASDEDRHALIIMGASVNRVFAYRLMSDKSTIEALRSVDFRTVSFSNEKSGFSSELFRQEYDLTK